VLIQKRDGMLWADIYWEDLSPEAQAQLFNLIGDNGNFDVFPIAIISLSQEEEEDDNQ